MKEIQAYLTFNGDCREAMNFYASALGAELTVVTFGETDPKTAPADRNKVMHARLARGATILMASDSVPAAPVRAADSVSLSIVCESDKEVDTLFAGLSAGGKPTVPPNDAFWGARFAMLTDRYGFHWMLNHERPKKG